MKALSRSLKHGDFDAVFREVAHSEVILWATEGELRLFHLNIRNNKITADALKRFTWPALTALQPQG